MSTQAGWRNQTIASLFSSSRPGEWGTDGTREAGTPVLRSTNFCDDGTIDYADIAYRTVPKTRLDARRINVGTILIEKAGGSSTRPAGRVVYCDREFGGTASNFVEVIQVDEAQSPKYVFYLLYNNFHSGLVYKYQQQTTGIINFKLGEYGSEFVDVPESRDEQSKIAEVLSTVDRAIAQTEALIAKQQRIKTGLMQDLLTCGIDKHGQLRSEATHAFKDSPLGRIPVEWGVKSLGAALGEAKGYLQTGPFGSQLHAHEYTHSGVPVVMPQDILQGSVSTANVARVPETRAHDLRRHRMMENDIVFSRRGDLSRAAAIGIRESGWLCGTGCFLLRVPLRNMAAKWLAHLYRHHWVQRQIETNAVGSTMPSLNNGVMARLVVPIPSVDEQRNIAHRINSMDRELELLEQQLDKQKSLKAALMQDLLTGKVRVTPLLQRAEEAIA